MQIKNQSLTNNLQGFDFLVVPVGHDPTTP